MDAMKRIPNKKGLKESFIKSNLGSVVNAATAIPNRMETSTTVLVRSNRLKKIRTPRIARKGGIADIQRA